MESEGEQIKARYRSQALEVALLELISEDRFSEMTMSEVIGTLELVKRVLAEELE